MKWQLISLMLLLVVSVSAQRYADITFDVSDTGETTISGDTNYPLFHGATENLTSKEGSHWFLNISAPVFEDFIYRVKLPAEASVNYIKASTTFRITNDNGITIIATGSNEPLSIVVQYSMNEENDAPSLWFIGIIAVAMLLVCYLVFFMRKKRHHHVPTDVHVSEVRHALKRELYTERQLEILDYLSAHGTATQAELEKALKLPKSSLSRNIEALVQKGIVFKEVRGMSNVIGLK